MLWKSTSSRLTEIWVYEYVSAAAPSTTTAKTTPAMMAAVLFTSEQRDGQVMKVLS